MYREVRLFSTRTKQKEDKNISAQCDPEWAPTLGRLLATRAAAANAEL